MAATKVPSHKVVLCGEFGVGKSSIFRRFVSNTFVAHADRSSMMGLDHFEKIYNIDCKNLKLQLWDTGGLERVASVTSSYYKQSKAAILVFSFDNADSFNILSQQILDVVDYSGTAKIFLCGNKTDLARQQYVTDENIRDFVAECGTMVSGVYRTSCKTGHGVSDMFVDIARHLAAVPPPVKNSCVSLGSVDDVPKKKSCDC